MEHRPEPPAEAEQETRHGRSSSSDMELLTGLYQAQAAGLVAQARRGKGGGASSEALLDAEVVDLRRQLSNANSLVRQREQELANSMDFVRQQAIELIGMRAQFEANHAQQEYREAILMNDFRELMQFNEEETRVLRREVVRQALPPPYAEIIHQHQPRLEDAGVAADDAIISSAMARLRKACARSRNNDDDDYEAVLLDLAQDLLESINQITQGLESNLWPVSSNAKVLRATTEMLERVAQNPLARTYATSAHPNSTVRQHLQRAVFAADFLATSALANHFEHGGRRGETTSATIPFVSAPDSITDTTDQTAELGFWRYRMLGVRECWAYYRVEAALGVKVFEGAVKWLDWFWLNS